MVRVSSVSLAQHLGEFFQRHWKVSRDRVLRDTGALAILKEKGIPVKEVKEVVGSLFVHERPVPPEPSLRQEVEVVSSGDFHEEPCLVFDNTNVLVEGLDQALVFTNSLLVDTTLPQVHAERFSSLDISSFVPRVKQCVKDSFLYDAEQKKLPIRKDPERPAWVFPRDYGITETRRNKLSGLKLLELCGQIRPDLIKNRFLVQDTYFRVALNRADKKVILSQDAEAVIFSTSGPSRSIVLKQAPQVSLPDLGPLSPLLSIQKTNHYKDSDLFPVDPEFPLHTIHTALVHYYPSHVQNLHESPVSETQFLSRSLMKAYCLAMTQAKTIKDGNLPILVQLVHTDAQRYHFSVLQLNSASDTGTPNYYWSSPVMYMFEECKYSEGRPVLTEFNPDVFKWLLAMYSL